MQSSRGPESSCLSHRPVNSQWWWWVPACVRVSRAMREKRDRICGCAPHSRALLRGHYRVRKVAATVIGCDGRSTHKQATQSSLNTQRQRNGSRRRAVGVIGCINEARCSIWVWERASLRRLRATILGHVMCGRGRGWAHLPSWCGARKDGRRDGYIYAYRVGKESSGDVHLGHLQIEHDGTSHQ